MPIIDHGKWSRYTPNNASYSRPYARRDSDGVDWYDYVFDDTPTFQKGSVLFIAEYLESERHYVVRFATRDHAAIIPAGFILHEITDFEGDDPQGVFGNAIYDPEAGEFRRAQPPEDPWVDIARRLARLEALIDGTQGKR